MHHIYAHRLLYSTKHNKQEKQHSNLREDISKYKSTSHFRAALMVITSTTEIADHSWIIYNLDSSLRVTSTASYWNNNTDSPILVLWFGRKFGDYSRVNNTLSLADTKHNHKHIPVRVCFDYHIKQHDCSVFRTHQPTTASLSFITACASMYSLASDKSASCSCKKICQNYAGLFQ